jgi:K+-sensing histidine kinase KdpD
LESHCPLASIKAWSSTLSDAEIDISPEARQSLAKLIDVQADRLAEFVQSLLDMSRIHAGVLEPRCTVVSLSVEQRSDHRVVRRRLR